MNGHRSRISRTVDRRSASLVAVAAEYHGYGRLPPFSPDRAGPEYPFSATTLSLDGNAAYAGVREALRLLGLDADGFETGRWNPLGAVVQPGDTVVLKPNFVRHFRESHSEHGDCLITHGAVIRAVLDYVFIALHGNGRIIIADAPQNDADFGAIRRLAGLDELREFYRRHAGFDVEVYDLRPERAQKIDGVIIGHAPLAGDPAGYVRVDLAERSAFAEIKHLCSRLYGAEYDTGELSSHQNATVHEYLISKTILSADCVISLPKLKTHKKTGITVNLKNMVGINGNKNWLPHHREGSPADGGDQFADSRFIHRLERATMSRFRRLFPMLGPLRPVLAAPIKTVGKRLFGDTNNGTVRSGNWHGNDTTWRMVIDLNRILLYADEHGAIQESPVRRTFSVVDGIVGGEGNGPLDPSPKASGVVLAGADPFAVDLTACRLMGFDYRRVPLLLRGLESHPLPLSRIGVAEGMVRSNDPRFACRLEEIASPALGFAPHFGWKGRVEL